MYNRYCGRSYVIMEVVNVLLLWYFQAVPKRRHLTAKQRYVTSQNSECLDTVNLKLSSTTNVDTTELIILPFK
jgi:hypothetical protein